MMIVMKEGATAEQVDAVINRVETVGATRPRLPGRAS